MQSYLYIIELHHPTFAAVLLHWQDKHTEPIDEEHVTRAHQEAYNGSGAGMSASSLGGAAAMEVRGQPHSCALPVLHQ